MVARYAGKWKRSVDKIRSLTFPPLMHATRVANEGSKERWRTVSSPRRLVL